MPYLVNATYGTKPKNKLQQAIAELVKKQDRLLLSDLEAEKFKDDLMQHIKGLHDKHPKCKPVNPHWWKNTRRPGTKEPDFHLFFDPSEFVSCVLMYAQPLNPPTQLLNL